MLPVDEPTVDIYEGPEGVMVVATRGPGQQWSDAQKQDAARVFGLLLPNKGAVEQKPESAIPETAAMVWALGEVDVAEGVKAAKTLNKQRSASRSKISEKPLGMLCAYVRQISATLAARETLPVSEKDFIASMSNRPQQRVAGALLNPDATDEQIRATLSATNPTRSVYAVIKSAHALYPDAVSDEMLPDEGKPREEYNLKTSAGVLHAIIRRAGITQPELAGKTGCDPTTLLRLLHGQRYWSAVKFNRLLAAANELLTQAASGRDNKTGVQPLNAKELHLLAERHKAEREYIRTLGRMGLHAIEASDD